MTAYKSRTEQAFSDGPGGRKTQSAGTPGASPARGAVESAQNKASEVTERVAESAQSALEKSKTAITEQIRAVAQAIERATEELRNGNQMGIAQRAEGLGQKLQRAADYVQRSNPRDMATDLERVVRKQPAWFLGGAFVIGLLAARFLKSSQDTQRSASSWGSPEVRYGTP